MFICACNPFKMKKINPNKEDDIMNIHPEMKNLLSHRVFPIPPRLLFDLWDYGSLSSQIEKKYIRAMLSQLKLETKYLNCFEEAVLYCQDYIKNTVEQQQSSVSLRDIKRVVHIFKFYYHVIAFRDYIEKQIRKLKLKSFLDDNSNQVWNFEEFCKKSKIDDFGKIEKDKFLTCFVISILINYIFRISEAGTFL